MRKSAQTLALVGGLVCPATLAAQTGEWRVLQAPNFYVLTLDAERELPSPRGSARPRLLIGCTRDPHLLVTIETRIPAWDADTTIKPGDRHVEESIKVAFDAERPKRDLLWLASEEAAFVSVSDLEPATTLRRLRRSARLMVQLDFRSGASYTMSFDTRGLSEMLPKLVGICAF